ncbi:hypothetical protein H9X85_09550 [Anaerotignum lactatifermentans]|uniref:Uncharacterized protein n=1 Tax=Anaerotignum lactatifermentans TaxID=160404 RepID=A0ABS2G9X7_9FIRM|nr:hypothetical protein [Anaerotignum lactatifermentans]MBM6830051.1 hypothetical protein [Anaerotignum lactatifermentans]MBM6878294.1 hypothetical protein [Anaerotignum lactatifermentans]MBM6951449.1 hypothetical protein [Anaerotignum lactatifermentans]
MKKLFAFLMAVMLLALPACSSSDNSASTDNSDSAQNETAEVQYDYQLKAGETAEVYDVTFDQMVTVTVDPASTRDASVDLRSGIYFDNCTFNGGLTVLGDYHAMISLGAGCSFGEGSVVTCKEVTPGVAKEATMDDNFVKVFVSCEGVTVETESAIGVIMDGPAVTFNGTVYNKEEIVPDASTLLGVYSVYENDTMIYEKLAIGDESVETLE